MLEEPVRSRAAREMAERALVHVVHHYGSRPEFVVLGGLVPELLYSLSEFRHAGTTDVDVQVDLEIACGAVNTKRLEHALRNAEFEPDAQRVWRWTTGVPGARTVVKFELLAELDDAPAGAVVKFDGCQDLGAAKLRGTGYAAEDIELRELRSRVGGVMQHVEINVTGLAGFLLAKCAAVQSRRASKDWYDIAFVLLHNDAGGTSAAAQAVRDRFGGRVDATRSSLTDLRATELAQPCVRRRRGCNVRHCLTQMTLRGQCVRSPRHAGMRSAPRAPTQADNRKGHTADGDDRAHDSPPPVIGHRTATQVAEALESPNEPDSYGQHAYPDENSPSHTVDHSSAPGCSRSWIVQWRSEHGPVHLSGPDS